MKHIVVFLFLIASVAINGQIVQKGSVTVFNSGKKPLAGTEILAIGAPATDADAAGGFSLNLANGRPGQALILSSVYKKGYEIVNRNIFSSWILSEKRPLEIVMAPNGTINESKEKYYNASLKNENARYLKVVNEINESCRLNKISEDDRLKKVTQLNNEVSARKEMLQQYADIFARINPDDIDAVEKKVLHLIEQGNMNEAIETYRTSQLLNKALGQLNISIKETDNIRTLIPVLYRFADVCIFSGGEANIKKAADIYKKIATDNPTDYTYVQKYANLLLNLQHKDAEVWIENCGKIATTATQQVEYLMRKSGILLLLNKNEAAGKSLGQLIQLLGDPKMELPFSVRYAHLIVGNSLYNSLFLRLGSYDEAIKMGLKNIEEIQKDKIIPADTKMEYLGNLYDAMSGYYASVDQYDKAREYEQKSFDIQCKYATNEEETNEATFSYYLSMASFDVIEHKLESAIAYCRKAIPLGEAIAKKKPQKNFLYSHAYVLLGSIAQMKGDWASSEKYYLQAYQILNLAPDTHELNLIGFWLNIATTLADLYITQNKMDKATIWVNKAYDMTSIVEKTDFIYYAKCLVMTYFSKAQLAYQQSNTQEAKKFYEMAFNVYEAQPNNQALSEQSYISILTNLGAIYMIEKNNTEAMRLLKKSQKIIQRKLKQEPESPELLISYANNVNNQGNIALELKNSAAAIDNFTQAKGIYEKFLPANEPQFTSYLVFAMMNLSSAYFMEKNAQAAEAMIAQSLEKTKKMSAQYPAIYQPIEVVVKLFQGVLYNRTGRSEQGQPIVARALEAAKAYSDNMIVKLMVGYYNNDELYQSK